MKRIEDMTRSELEAEFARLEPLLTGAYNRNDHATVARWARIQYALLGSPAGRMTTAVHTAPTRK